MLIRGKPSRSIWLARDGQSVRVIDQRLLPHRVKTLALESVDDAVEAITDMAVRGAPLIGATAAWGVWLAVRRKPTERALENACTRLLATRPTAVNLRWALEEMRRALEPLPERAWPDAARTQAAAICDADVATNEAIAKHGYRILRDTWERRHTSSGTPLQVLTHCNAGWIATVDWGTALAPLYWAHRNGVPIHVWVDETRPRNQGAALTTWELREQGIPHTLIVDNAGGHLLQHGRVDLCIVGADRVTARGDVCNKIGTYLKALAAHDNGVPFYVALPSSTIDWSIQDGRAEIPIEERDPTEVTHVGGRLNAGRMATVQICPVGTQAANFGFDVTPARLVTGLITERGLAAASAEGLRKLFPERSLTRPTAAD